MANPHHKERERRLPVVQEELHVGKRIVDTGKGVRLNKTVSEDVWRVEDSLLRQTVDIEHVPVDAWVTGEVPSNRYEGNTLVVPVLEEVLVVEKRLRLKEELRITVTSSTQNVSERVVLRKEQVTVERFDHSSEHAEPPAVSPVSGASPH